MALVLASASAAQDSRAPVSSSPVRIGRLVGVFDFDSGVPLAGVRVLDMRTRWSAMTTSTGTVSLSFVDSVGSLIQFGKLGYESQRFYVANSAVDTAGITVLLKVNGQSLPAVVTRARGTRGPTDTVRALELNGFYDRRNSTGAPGSSFVTSEKIARLSLLADLGRITGRPICTANLYINGAKVTVPTLSSAMPGGRSRVVVAPPRRSGLDAMLMPEDVLAVEMYKVGDAPSEFNPTSGGRCGATLVWTK